MSAEIRTLDALLEQSGHQIKNYIVIGISSFLVTSFALTYIFTTSQLKYRCVVPECENSQNTSYLTPWLKHAVPFNKDGSPKNCFRYSIAREQSDSCDSSSFDKTKLVKCNSWVFETNEVNLLNEFHLECDENKWKLALIGSLDGIGALVGTPFCAFISDKFGRKRALCIFSILCVILGFVRSFSFSYTMYAILDFFNAFLDFGIFGTSFVLCMELVSSRHRTFANIVFNLFGALGYAFLGAIGIWVPHWRWMLRALYANGIVFLLYFWITPESIKWLLIKNRKPEAVQVIKDVIKGNPKTEHVDIETILNAAKKQDAETVDLGYLRTLCTALKSCKLLTRLIHSSLCWIGAVFLWYGTLQQSVALSGDKHSNCFFSALAQVPGYVVSAFSIKLGHKATMFSSLTIYACASISFYFLPEEYTTARLILYLLSTTGVTCGYAVLYMSTVAMFPTPLRQSLLAFCCMVGRTGQVLAPQVFQLGSDIPLLIFGCVALGVATLTMFLPETFHLELPDTIKQAENVGIESTQDIDKESS